MEEIQAWLTNPAVHQPPAPPHRGLHPPDERPEGAGGGQLGRQRDNAAAAPRRAQVGLGTPQALVLALVATTTVMAVQDRIKEHAVLQTLGLRPGRIFRLVLAESVLQSIAGGLLGIGAGLAMLAWGGFAVGAEGVTIAFKPSTDLALTGATVSVVVGLLAGIAPGWQAARTEIVLALRQA